MVLARELAAIDRCRAVVDADAQPDAREWRHVRHAPRQSFLDLDRAAHRREGARELGAHALGFELEDAAAVDGDRGIDHLVVAELQGCLGRAGVVRSQALIVGHVGHQDRRELLLDVDPHDLTPPAPERPRLPFPAQSKLRRAVSRSKVGRGLARKSARPPLRGGPCPVARQRIVPSRSAPAPLGNSQADTRELLPRPDLQFGLCKKPGAQDEAHSAGEARDADLNLDS
jgi:hypothetical protein